jgi:(3R)-3-hydroxyacyl-CoA dehydrogenase / 3a,7a,12a-trihydroxy-5b-cholest-24-enoyl-CoA hydratase / enoyl-CoA hydratase 2
MMKSYLD